MEEKIRVEYYTVDGKTHTFETSLIKTATEAADIAFEHFGYSFWEINKEHEDD